MTYSTSRILNLAIAKRLASKAKTLVLAVDEDTKKHGVMVALILPTEIGEKIAIEGGESPEDMHITLIYLGDDSDFDASGIEKVKTLVSTLAAQTNPLQGILGGYGRFSGPEADVFHATVDIPGLSEFRTKLADGIKALGLSFKEDHGFSPHLTLKYVEDQESPNPEVRLDPIDVTFSDVVLKVGEDATEFVFRDVPSDSTNADFQLTAVVVKRGNEWRIRKHDSNELLPQHYKTKEDADSALRAIEMHKHAHGVTSLITAAELLLADLSPEDVKNEWSKMEPLFRSLKETEREPISLESLGLKKDDGVNNIIKVYNTATPEEKEYWGRWYLHASSVVQQTANRYDIDLPTAAGVFAVLSPGNKWWINARVADKLIFFWKNGALNALGNLNAYPRNVRMAIKILEDGTPSALVKGPKTGVFYDSLVDPEGVERSIVLDGHAVNIWRGVKGTVKEGKIPNDKVREQIEADYSKAAAKLHIPEQSLQAVTWYMWKFIK